MRPLGWQESSFLRFAALRGVLANTVCAAGAKSSADSRCRYKIWWIDSGGITQPVLPSRLRYLASPTRHYQFSIYRVAYTELCCSAFHGSLRSKKQRVIKTLRRNATYQTQSLAAATHRAANTCAQMACVANAREGNPRTAPPVLRT